MINTNKVALVAKREYLKVIRKPTFWISTLFFPVFMVVISFISGYSAVEGKKATEINFDNVKKIYIVDQTKDKYIKQVSFENDPTFNDKNRSKFEIVTDLDKAVNEIKSRNANAVLVYPADFLEKLKVDIYSDDTNPLSRDKYSPVADQLFRRNIVSQIKEQQLVALYTAPISFNVTSYNEKGNVEQSGVEAYLLPYVFAILYIILVSFATSYLLLSVSEEKENRMIETVISIMKPSDLITGKIIGQVGIIITQVILLGGLSLVVLKFTSSNSTLPFNLANIQLDPIQLILAFIYVFLGFIFLSAIMVGVGAATPNYKDAQSMSGIFVMLAVIPLYFVMLIMTNPNGSLAVITSYLPFTSSIVLLFRNALITLPVWEIVLSIVSQIIYCALGIFLAYKLFEIGSLEYTQRISLKSISSMWKRKSK